jgi:hypothetical protein
MRMIAMATLARARQAPDCRLGQTQRLRTGGAARAILGLAPSRARTSRTDDGLRKSQGKESHSICLRLP